MIKRWKSRIRVISIIAEAIILSIIGISRIKSPYVRWAVVSLIFLAVGFVVIANNRTKIEG